MRPLSQTHPLTARRARSRNLIRGKSVKTTLPYYSVGRFELDVDTGVFTLAKGTEIKLFGYKIGEDMGQAGRDGEKATPADTNIVVSGQTIDSEAVTIVGIACQVIGGGAVSDPLAAMHCAPNISVSIQFNGSKRQYLYGNLEMIPGMNGFSGSGASVSAGDTVSAFTSGWPVFSNYFRIPEGIDWNPASSADSSLVVVLRAERETSFEVEDSDADASSFDVRFQLVCTQEALGSTNM